MSISHLTTILIVAIPVAASAAGRRDIVDEIAAVIETEIITMRELELKAAPFMDKVKEETDQAKREKKRIELLHQVLDIEISERIVGAEIERNKDRLGVIDDDVDRAVEEVLRMNSLTEQQLQAALYSQSITWSEYRKKLRVQIERARLIQFKVQGKVQIKDDAVKRRCRDRQRAGTKEVKVCASHILRKIPTDADAEAIERLRAQLSQLQAELTAGADFAAYAMKNSDDTSAPDGDLGCFGRGEMVESFERALFALKVGEVSPVIRTKFGFHIAKVTDLRHPSVASCGDEETLTPFKNELYQEALDRQMNVWLAELRRKAFVDVRF